MPTWLTIAAFLTLLAFLLTLAAAMGRVPLWAAVLLLSLVELLRTWPR
jgi:hypothetical protein